MFRRLRKFRRGRVIQDFQGFQGLQDFQGGRSLRSLRNIRSFRERGGSPLESLEILDNLAPGAQPCPLRRPAQPSPAPPPCPLRGSGAPLGAAGGKKSAVVCGIFCIFVSP